MHSLPLTFEYKGKEYKGLLDNVNGSWHSTIETYHYGQLIYSNTHGFQFHLHLKNAGMERLQKRLANNL